MEIATSTSNIEDTPLKYHINAIQLGGYGSKTVSIDTRAEDDILKPVEQYASYSFNHGLDILYVGCHDGYEASKASSPTKNEVGVRKDLGDAYIVIDSETKMRNELIVLCEKSQ